VYFNPNPMKRLLCSAIVFLGFAVYGETAGAQGILQRAKQAVQKAADKALGEEDKEETQQAPGSPQPGSPAGKSATKMSPPDVLKYIGEADASLAAKDLNNARFSVQQALVGVEWKLGYKLLESLPASVAGLECDKESDNVTISGIGFVGMAIERSYRQGDKHLDLGILNNSGLLNMYGMYLSNPAYSADENRKAVRVGNYRGLLEQQDDGDFTLGIPFGQSSLLLLDCGRFQNEDEVLNAAKAFDIDKIKTTLGEQ
jgi:hypothetical protein